MREESVGWIRFDLLFGAEDFFHGFAFGEFVDEFVEVADFAHEWFFDFFDAYAADDAFDEGSVGVEFGGFGEEVFEVGFFIEVGLELSLGVAGEPADDFIDFSLGAVFFLGFGDVVGVDAGKAHGVDFVFFHGWYCGVILGRVQMVFGGKDRHFVAGWSMGFVLEWRNPCCG